MRFDFGKFSLGTFSPKRKYLSDFRTQYAQEDEQGNLLMMSLPACSSRLSLPANEVQ